MSLSASRIWAISKKEFFHLRRDHLTGGMVVGLPVIMCVLFGYAINTDVRNLSAAVVDEANTSASRALVAGVVASQVLKFVQTAHSVQDLEYLIAAGEISVGVYIPPDFEARLIHQRTPYAQLLVDDSDPVILGAVRGLMNMPIGVSRNVESNVNNNTFEPRPLYNPERRSAVFIVPGLYGVILTLSMVLFTAIAVVRERERGNLELLITTPVLSLELMIGKVVPYVVIGYVQITIILLLGVFLFDVPMRGTLVDLYVGSGVFIISTLSLGLLISTMAETQFQAFQITFMSFLPQLLLSGFMFPFEGMPRGAQILAEIFPLTHFLRVVRGVILREANLTMLSAELWPLALFFVVVMLLATLRFQKRLD
ncbi:MAG: ABC transporter permease [Gammaproteobacteria bacterium]|nr:ABC transporter permease [Gammaproteobacteria bacterium]